jgi:hypothetical protein
VPELVEYPIPPELDGESRIKQSKQKTARVLPIVGKAELALHTFNNGRYCFVGLLPVGSAEPHASEDPICIKARLWRDASDDYANEGIASGFSFLDGFSYRDCKISDAIRQRSSVGLIVAARSRSRCVEVGSLDLTGGAGEETIATIISITPDASRSREIGST